MEGLVIGEELRESVPLKGNLLAERMSRRVDFPAPLGPTMARISEGYAVRETSLRM